MGGTVFSHTVSTIIILNSHLNMSYGWKNQGSRNYVKCWKCKCWNYASATKCYLRECGVAFAPTPNNNPGKKAGKWSKPPKLLGDKTNDDSNQDKDNKKDKEEEAADKSEEREPTVVENLIDAQAAAKKAGLDTTEVDAKLAEARAKRDSGKPVKIQLNKIDSKLKTKKEAVESLQKQVTDKAEQIETAKAEHAKALVALKQAQEELQAQERQKEQFLSQSPLKPAIAAVKAVLDISHASEETQAKHAHHLKKMAEIVALIREDVPDAGIGAPLNNQPTLPAGSQQLQGNPTVGGSDLEMEIDEFTIDDKELDQISDDKKVREKLKSVIAKRVSDYSHKIVGKGVGSGIKVKVKKCG